MKEICGNRNVADMPEHSFSRYNLRKTSLLIILIFLASGAMNGVTLSAGNDIFRCSKHLKKASLFSTDSDSLHIILSEKPAADPGIYPRRFFSSGVLFYLFSLSADLISPVPDLLPGGRALSASSKFRNNIKNVIYCLKTIILRN